MKSNKRRVAELTPSKVNMVAKLAFAPREKRHPNRPDRWDGRFSYVVRHFTKGTNTGVKGL